MGEREELDRVVERMRVSEAAIKSADATMLERARLEDIQTNERMAAAREALCDKLRELSREYRPLMRFSFTEGATHQRAVTHRHVDHLEPYFDVSIGWPISPVLRAPFASVRITVTPAGYIMRERLGQSGPVHDLAGTIEAIRQLAATFVAKQEVLPYELPKWLTQAANAASQLLDGAAGLALLVASATLTVSVVSVVVWVLLPPFRDLVVGVAYWEYELIKENQLIAWCVGLLAVYSWSKN